MNRLIALVFFSVILFTQVNAQLLTTQQVALTSTAGSSITVNGDALFQNASTWVNNGSISISGDFTNSSGNNLFGTSAGTVTMNGSAQDIGGTSATIFNNLTMSGTGTVTLSNDQFTGGGYVGPTGVLAVGSKQIILNSNRLTVNNPGVGAITRTSGFIVSETGPAAGYGRVEWMVNNPSSGVYTWPFGNDITNEYIPVTITFNSAGMNNGSFSIATYPTDPFQDPNNRPLPLGIPSVNDAAGNENAPNMADRYWMINTSGYAVEPTGDLLLSYRDSEANGGNNIFNENVLGSQHHDGISWSMPPAGIPDGINNKVLTPLVSEWDSVWVLVANFMPLPVALVGFDAKPQGSDVLCTWETVSEINNDYFTIERSIDAVNFENIGEVDGAGTSAEHLYYDFTDTEPVYGWSYYRLRQTDLSGMSTHTNIKAVYFGFEGSWDIVIYPNPFYESVNIDIAGQEEDVLFSVFDQRGRVVASELWPAADSGEKISLLFDLSFLEAGIYTLRVVHGMNSHTTRLVKQ